MVQHDLDRTEAAHWGRVRACVPFTLAIFILACSAEARALAFDGSSWNVTHSDLSPKQSENADEKSESRLLTLAKDDRHLSLGGSARSRVNVYANDLFGLQSGNDGSVWLQRLYGHADLHINNGHRIFLELSSHLANTSGQLRLGPLDRSDAALSQAFVDWRFGNSQLRLGRQEFVLGSARLLSVRDGPNVRLSYDGLRWDHALGRLSLTGFYLQEVKVNPGAFDNRSRRDNVIWGINGTWAIGNVYADTYYLHLKRKDAQFFQGSGEENRHSVGARLFGSHSNWDWNLEALYQFGRFNEADIRAWTVASVVGFRLTETAAKPWLALSANIASGDDDPDDERLGTFNPLFPNLAYFEEAALYAPQNFFNLKPKISWMAAADLELTLDWNFFWRLEKNDTVYVRGLVPLLETADAQGRFVAHTPSFGVDYQWSRYVSLGFSYSHFFVGELIRNAGGKDTSFFRLQINWKF